MESAKSENLNWQTLEPDSKGDWLNHGNSLFEQFIPLGDKANKNNTGTFFKPVYSLGLATNRDAWCYNFSKHSLAKNIKHTIDYFNNLVKKGKFQKETISPKDIVMTDMFEKDLQNKHLKTYNPNDIYSSIYRPFTKEYCYFSRELNQRVYQLPTLFPKIDTLNKVICVSGIGANKPFSCIITDAVPNLDTVEKAQCFPLYYYDKKSQTKPSLLDSSKKDEYIRHDTITDFILERCQENYGKNVTKEDIFYYVYGLLHSPEYRKTFANDLKKSLPRLPLVDKPEDFWTFSNAGRDLADLHLNYENQPPCADVRVTGAESGNFHVEKMRFPNKEDKSVIQYNSDITISNIPLEAYDYVVNGRSAIEWIMERYQIKVDKASGIVNDPNEWAKEHGKPRYILDLLLSIITVSLKTINIIIALPKINLKV